MLVITEIFVQGVDRTAVRLRFDIFNKLSASVYRAFCRNGKAVVDTTCISIRGTTCSSRHQEHGILNCSNTIKIFLSSPPSPSQNTRIYPSPHHLQTLLPKSPPPPPFTTTQNKPHTAYTHAHTSPPEFELHHNTHAQSQRNEMCNSVNT